MVLGIYSLLMAALWVVLDAVDVAFTEAAVGAGVTTVLMLLTIALTGHEEKRTHTKPWLPLAVSLATAGLLVYATLGMQENVLIYVFPDSFSATDFVQPISLNPEAQVIYEKTKSKLFVCAF